MNIISSKDGGKFNIDTEAMRKNGEDLIDIIDKFAKERKMDVIETAFMLVGISEAYKNVIQDKVREIAGVQN